MASHWVALNHIRLVALTRGFWHFVSVRGAR